MKRFLTTLVAGAALILPAAALAGHTDWDYDETYMYDSMDECEDALAEQRRMMSMDLRGRDRGQFNKDFNQRYECMESGDYYMIDDTYS